MTKASKLLQKLDELVHVPIPMLDNEEWACIIALANEPKLQKKISLSTQKVDDIQPTQWALQKDKVAELIKSGDFNGGLVIKRRGELKLWDGHHRLAGAKEANKEKIRVRVLVLPDNKPFGLKDFASLLAVDIAEILAAMDSGDRAVYE